MPDNVQPSLTQQQKNDLYAETVAKLRGSLEAWRDCALAGIHVEPSEKLAKITRLVDLAWLAAYPDEAAL